MSRSDGPVIVACVVVDDRYHVGDGERGAGWSRHTCKSRHRCVGRSAGRDGRADRDLDRQGRAFVGRNDRTDERADRVRRHTPSSVYTSTATPATDNVRRALPSRRTVTSVSP